MAWIRLSDNYVDHPKFQALSDGSFRLWHEAMAFCRRHQSDGFFSFSVMKGFRYYTKGREKQLATPHEPGARPLWSLVPGGGYKVHDYLEWNLSKEEEANEKTGAAARMRKFRAKPESGDGVRYGVTPSVTLPVTNALVPDMDRDKSTSSEKEEKKNDDLGERAGTLLQELYPAWYAKYRRGARLRLVSNTLAFHDALSVVTTWDDARIEKLARIVLTTDEPFIASTDRSFRIFAMKASWADDRLTEAESGAA